MTIRFLNVAQVELGDAINWYNSQAVGLGDAFLIEAIKRFVLSSNIPMLGIVSAKIRADAA